MVVVAGVSPDADLHLSRLDRLLDGHLVGHDGDTLSFDFASLMDALYQRRDERRCHYAVVLQCGGFGACRRRHGRPLLPDIRHHHHELVGFRLRPSTARQHSDAIRPHCWRRRRIYWRTANLTRTTVVGGIRFRINRFGNHYTIRRKEGVVFYHKIFQNILTSEELFVILQSLVITIVL